MGPNVPIMLFFSYIHAKKPLDLSDRHKPRLEKKSPDADADG